MENGKQTYKLPEGWVEVSSTDILIESKDMINESFGFNLIA